jgi:hypothetical protein
MSYALEQPVPVRRAAGDLWRHITAALAVGLGGGGTLTMLASGMSPWLGVAGVAGLLVCGAMLISPSFALMVVGASLPVERIGRLTEDTQTVTISLSRIIGLVSMLALGLHILVRRLKIVVNPGLWLYGGYTCMALLTILWSNYPDDTTRDALRIVTNLGFYFYLINAIRKYSLVKAVLLVWLASSVATTVYAVYDYHLGKTEEIAEDEMGLVSERTQAVVEDDSETRTLGEKVRRVFGTTSHPTIFGLNLTMTVPFFAFFMRIERRTWLRVLYLVSLALVFYGIFLSNTRAVILLAAGTIIAIVWKGLFRFTPTSILAAVLLAVCVIPLIPRDVYLRSLDPQLYTTEKSGSFKVRFKFWAKSFELIEQHWLTGIGVGDQTTIVNMVTDELAGRITPQGVKASAHNEFIWSMVEVGIFGWLMHWSFVVWIFSRAIRAGSHYYRADPEGEKYYLCVAIQIMLIGVVLFGVQQEVFHIPLKGWWLNAAIATFLYSSTRQSHSAEEISSFDLVPAEAT